MNFYETHLLSMTYMCIIFSCMCIRTIHGPTQEKYLSVVMMLQKHTDIIKDARSDQ